MQYHVSPFDTPEPMRETIAFIGGGNMATSLIGGLQSAGHPGERTIVVEPDADKRAQLTRRFGLRAEASADSVAREADVLVLAVKPQVLPEVARVLSTSIGTPAPLVISIAAGIRSDALVGWLGDGIPVIRCMPNTPSLIGAGATALFARRTVDAQQRALAQALLAGAGETVWVDDESTLDVVTATSGSGPAYFFAFMEAMERAATDLGLAPETARTLVIQTALGAARMVHESGDDPGTLRERVTSPGGTTERALAVLDEGGFEALVARAMRAAADRSVALADEFATR